MSEPKPTRFKRKRNDAEKAAEAGAGVKSAQGVAALVLAKADPKPPRKP